MDDIPDKDLPLLRQGGRMHEERQVVIQAQREPQNIVQRGHDRHQHDVVDQGRHNDIDQERRDIARQERHDIGQLQERYDVAHQEGHDAPYLSRHNVSQLQERRDVAVAHRERQNAANQERRAVSQLQAQDSERHHVGQEGRNIRQNRRDVAQEQCSVGQERLGHDVRQNQRDVAQEQRDVGQEQHNVEHTSWVPRGPPLIEKQDDVFGPYPHTPTTPRPRATGHSWANRLEQRDLPVGYSLRRAQKTPTRQHASHNEGRKPLGIASKTQGGGFYHFRLRSRSRESEPSPNPQQQYGRSHNPIHSPYYRAQDGYVRAESLPPSTPSRTAHRGSVAELPQSAVDQPPSRAQSINEELYWPPETTSQRSTSRPRSIRALTRSDSQSSSGETNYEIDWDDFPEETIRALNLRDIDNIESTDDQMGDVTVIVAQDASEEQLHDAPENVVDDIVDQTVDNPTVDNQGADLETPGGFLDDDIPGSGMELEESFEYGPENDADDSSADEDDDGLDGLSPKRRKSESTKRLSKKTIANIKKRLLTVGKELENIADDTGATVAQVYSLWKAADKKVRDVDHSWQLYQAYYTERQATEDARLSLTHMSTQAMSSGDRSTHVAKCYRKFKRAYPEKFAEILLTWDTLRKIDNPGTVGKRTGEFKKFYDHVQGLVDRYDKIHGFQSIVLFGGSIANQDSGIGGLIESTGAQGYFEEMWDVNNKYMISNFQAHCVHGASQKDSRSKAMTARAKTSESDEKGETKDGEKDTVKAQDQGNKMIAKKTEPGDVKVLRELFVVFLEPLGCSLIEPPKDTDSKKQGNFPWRQLPEKLAAAGLRLENWPYGAGYPENGNGKPSKGIAEVPKEQRRLLENALKDRNASYALQAVRDDSMIEDYHKSNYVTVIVGAAPPPHAKHAKGLRLRVKRGNGSRSSDIKPEWKGLPRCPPRESSPVVVVLDDEQSNNDGEVSTATGEPTARERRRQSNRLKEKQAQREQKEDESDFEPSDLEYAPSVVPGSVADEVPVEPEHVPNLKPMKEATEKVTSKAPKTIKLQVKQTLHKTTEKTVNDINGEDDEADEASIDHTTSSKPNDLKAKRKAADSESEYLEASKKQKVAITSTGEGTAMIHRGSRLDTMTGGAAVVDIEEGGVQRRMGDGSNMIYEGSNISNDRGPGSYAMHGGQDIVLGGLNVTNGGSQVMTSRGLGTQEGMQVGGPGDRDWTTSTGGMMHAGPYNYGPSLQIRGGGHGPGPSMNWMSSGRNTNTYPMAQMGQQGLSSGHQSHAPASGRLDIATVHGHTPASEGDVILDALTNGDISRDELKRLVQLGLQVIGRRHDGPGPNVYPSSYGAAGGGYGNSGLGQQEQHVNSNTNVAGSSAMSLEGSREPTYGGQRQFPEGSRQW